MPACPEQAPGCHLLHVNSQSSFKMMKTLLEDDEAHIQQVMTKQLFSRAVIFLWVVIDSYTERE